MRRVIFSLVGIVSVGFFTVVLLGQQAQPPATTGAYAAQCSSCHGAAMTGARDPGILAYIRYHTDAEATAQIRQKHPSLQLSDEIRRQVIADTRALAGTNPAMATSGFTGRRGGPGGGGPAQAGAGGPRGQGPAAGLTPMKPTTMQQATINMADGKTRTGILLGRTDLDATLLENGTLVLLSRDGDVYREKAIAPKADWSSYDGAQSGNRYSPLDQISTTTVRRLGPAWIFPMPNATRLEVTPTVVDGIMYVSAWNEVHALDATTGMELWNYSQPRTEGIQGDGGGGANRGVTVSGDSAYYETDHAHLLAFNRFTGEKRWDVEMASYKNGYSASSPPLPVGDLLITGVAGGEEGARGFVDAYRQSTGERVWRFYSIPARGEPAAETWQGQALEHGCGPTWLPGSYDPTLDLVYWAIGNPCPDINGEERIGDNLYTSSVVALSPKTGALKWYYQFSPHDTHDWDAVQPMLLVDEVWQGRPRKLLMHGDRNGMFYVLDRTNGEFLLADKLSTKVTWVKGFTKEGKPIVDPASIASKDGSAACPGLGGGANWPAASYNPGTKLFYTRVSDSCTLYTSYDDPLGNTGTRWWGRGGPSPNGEAALRALMDGYQTGTFLRAMNPFTGKKVWDFPGVRTGVLSTAGGLVFVGGAGGLLALDAKTGKPVWNSNVAPSGLSTPMTYMVGGRQYVALPGTGAILAYAMY
jgi:alcohol dehydrogenase (cytochrome c)